MRAGILIAVLLMGACSAPPAGKPAPAPAPPVLEPDGVSNQDSTVISGIDLFLWGRAVAEVEQKPVFKLHAGQASAMDGAGYRFEDAEAWSFNKDTGVEEFHLIARQGIFKQNEEAYLDGGVEANTATMQFRMEDITWTVKEDGMTHAWTENPVTLSGDEMHIDAEGLELYPAEERLVLKEIRGTIQLGAMGVQ